MKRIAIVLFLMLATLAEAQTDNTIYVKQFQGPDVGTKLTKAMNACNGQIIGLGCSSTGGGSGACEAQQETCILVIEPSLGLWPTGTMPPLCAHCTLLDYRTPGSIGNFGQAMVQPQFGGTGQNESTASGVGTWINGVYVVTSTLPATTTATTRAATDASAALATMAAVQAVKTAGGATLAAPNTLTGLPAGCVQLPCTVASTGWLTYTGNAGLGPIWEYVVPQGNKHLYVSYQWIIVTGAGTAGTMTMLTDYKQNGVNQQPYGSSYNIPVTSVGNTLMDNITIMPDPGTQVGFSLSNASNAGNPSFLYQWSLIEMQ